MTLDPSDRAAVAAFIRSEARAVVATVTDQGAPEAALVGAAALDDGTLVFDAPAHTRKIANMQGHARVAVVVGLCRDVSLQLEGDAIVTDGAERDRLGAAYNAQLPGSRALDAGFAVVAVRPDWVRVYDVSGGAAQVAEAAW
ncbi:pyridoxamine 5'-phosphate oxidase family protein [Microbacterium protaetiae]|uniref:Pyridoxamine 5'-phosphate oxidase family protein n=1 Tax=Microbacterium protaetiae TaxID=2509458 RepID=A0A4P6EBP6_9MICO|nr:pyridoxamine 5'-phosphate oxidase family protein [Microbacterium protaetiae]QAY59605.1 pyridoxamine 5'-phosphate oxidase family protein [Microbacterium protaetiae]